MPLEGINYLNSESDQLHRVLIGEMDLAQQSKI